MVGFLFIEAVAFGNDDAEEVLDQPLVTEQVEANVAESIQNGRGRMNWDGSSIQAEAKNKKKAVEVKKKKSELALVEFKESADKEEQAHIFK